MASRKEHIYNSDISAVSISFADAIHHTLEELDNDSKAAAELNKSIEIG